LCMVCFAGGLALLSRVPVLYADRVQLTETSGWKRFTAGLHFIRTRPIILGTISLDLFAVLLGGVIALLPIYASDVLHVGPGRVVGRSVARLRLAGAAAMVRVDARATLIRFSTPDAMRGRVNAVNRLFIGSANELGHFRAGTSAAWFGAVPAALIGALCTLGVVAGWAAAFRSLRQVDRVEDAAAATEQDTAGRSQ